MTAGARRSDGNLIFVVHKHAARSLHYDLRLRVGDALRSWAVPKGPSMEPGVKRLAVAVEDHDLDYADFEGVIGDGYGAGTVMVWDCGVWRCRDDDVDAAGALDAGALAFTLDGKKLTGGFRLVRTRMGGKDKNWLLIKSADERATPVVNVLDMDRSAVSNLTMDEISPRQA